MALKFPAFLNATIRQPRWLAATELAFNAWVKLACRCAEDENGGRLGGASSWDERIWLTLANVTLAGVAAAVSAGLAQWDGDTLVIIGYDQDSEGKVQTLRANGVHGEKGAAYGHLGGRPRTKNPHSKPPKGVSHKPPLTLPFPPSPSDPSVSATTDATGEKPGGEDPGSGENAQPSSPPASGGGDRWQGWRWYDKFAYAWGAARGQLKYGRGSETDAKATADLTVMLRSLDDAEALDAQAAAPRMFELFFADQDAGRAGHLWSWFVRRWNQLRATALGKGPAQAAGAAKGYAVVKGGKDWSAGMDKVNRR